MCERWSFRVAAVSILLLVCCSSWVERTGAAAFNYEQALQLSFHFFDAQRSGYLPRDGRATWRFNSGLHDGRDQGVDLVGGYYDAGDNVKFGFPMAFAITMLSWSVVEYGEQMQQQGQLNVALDSIKWGTDYFIKAHPEPNVLWAEVGDGESDHSCWERPEDMTTPRQAYKLDANNPGSEVAAETAAAMAAASICFRAVSRSYSALLLAHAQQLFSFADTYRGRYDNSIPNVKPFYPSGPSGYSDELLWAAFWLFEATGDQYYLKYTVDNAESLGGTTWAVSEFGWDMKYAGLQVLAAKILLSGRGGSFANTLAAYKAQAEHFMCSALGRSSGLQRTPGGLWWTQTWNNMQYVTSAAFLVTVYGDILSATGTHLYCSGSLVQPYELLGAGKSQVDYILGNNPKGISYMVGYGSNYPQFVHHRGASIPSIQSYPESVECREGYSIWYSRPEPNPNVLVGGVIGGPDQNDDFVDRRENWQGSEACLYNNPPLVGVLARLTSSRGASSNSFSGISLLSFSYPTHTTHLRLTQQLVLSWKFRGVEYYKYEGTLTNDSPRVLDDFILTSELVDGPVHGLRQIGNTFLHSIFTFPRGKRALLPGQSLNFMYISRRSTPFETSLYLARFAQ